MVLFQEISGTIFGKNGIGNPTTEHESYDSHRILLPGLLDNWGGADPDITGMPSLGGWNAWCSVENEGMGIRGLPLCEYCRRSITGIHY